MKRFRLVLLFGVALPTLLLGWGWYASRASELQTALLAREARAVRTADAVRAAVDESLEELRVRESKRPFYLYNFYYSPPDALALQDPVLVSPLSKPPEDPRLVGYFTVEPGAVVATPHARVDSDLPQFAANMVSHVETDVLPALRHRIGGFEDNVVSAGNAFSTQQAEDLQNAAAGDAILNDRLVEQGRQNPVTGARVHEEPMAWHVLGDQLLLRRFVRDEGGVETFQGVVMDHHHMLAVWLPRLVSRHADGAATLVSATEDAACAVRRPVSATLPLAELCIEALPPEQAAGPWQVGALFGLLCIVFAGVYVVHRGSRQAEELAEKKGRFVSAVTHELRTPLTTMRMHAEMLRDGLVSRARQKKVHHELAEQSKRLGDLIENVLDLSRIESGEALDCRVTDLVACVARAAERQREGLAEAGLTLELDGPAAHDAYIDPVAVERVVVNLLENAKKYAAGCEPSVVRVSVGSDEATIVVRDHGPGVAPDERDRVFERFHRATERDDVAGTGIGLSLVRDIALAHGGGAEILPTATGCAVRVVLA